ncbi:hypothetical protein Rumeso_04933 [Rubellimicrobium mesophilum DSM 19309]|uniref:Uncharacterized protein n=1 Tax=Rubellimicrobium mesophilum DSM 19309 TaxID=442562 RepID=A0A017HAQ1_9RHOB|nr:hypothetical protein [Rubellimicrobium mesophilum]EYD71532.1 hypothetical protein Rumeso_04933 [Rubellimicrobium mesophilum DSM 19309]
MVRSAVALALGLVPAVASAQAPCQEIRFAPGASEGVVTGEVPADSSLCFTIEVGEGQHAEVSVEDLGPDVMIVTVPGVSEVQESIDWTTRAGIYEIRVMPLFRSRGYNAFRLRVAVSGG